ncbi:hypothetical protein SAMN05660909_05674 [Chitinophaga terrae (ex Kim and Jung 2007)]|uniref:Uncharacterized protein n=1 Tax=Chitinophaga terrae (ex Kim and Jung 2007) TaxID=408074 RepID=A0A1H4GT38_9BACT|nr:hypothetical protein [Chitinophaga terrae (ex Kim and Jung 2007)]GEP93717.1 hypothetical protein CTE07_53620 [Chitinophaga terrae (ex Kim and Jung 2007)]SEB12501.1 hypothetical protein SAMN05660909_05674 [Chitinophaga terrae (ex Kim and Jung 2007)]
MTAVIGIINKSAAAIATDSAVTVTGPKGPKIFNRANKIFTLSKSRPVGLMIYNQGEFMGTSWEVIIKLYRAELGDTGFDTLEEYKNDFIAFLHRKNFFCDVNQQKMILYYFICNFLHLLADSTIKENQQQIQGRVNDLQNILSNALIQKINLLLDKYRRNTDFCTEFVDFSQQEYDQFGFTGLPNAINQVFLQNGLIIDPAAILPSLKELIFIVLKSKDLYNFYSGLVFTGYGDSEIFPRLFSVNVSFAINNRLRYFDDEKSKAIIDHQQVSAIRPFAQTDVINTILGGIDPALNQIYFQQFEDFITKNNASIAQMVEQSDPNLANRIRGIDANGLTSTLHKLIGQETKKHYIDQVMGAVSTLSKEDLAEMAESLIYLTYLKRRFTFAPESVGGPVDVAIITKGDGFVWIKRKHYFNAELNHHFFKKY